MEQCFVSMQVCVLVPRTQALHEQLHCDRQEIEPSACGRMRGISSCCCAAGQPPQSATQASHASPVLAWHMPSPQYCPSTTSNVENPLAINVTVCSLVLYDIIVHAGATQTAPLRRMRGARKSTFLIVSSAGTFSSSGTAEVLMLMRWYPISTFSCNNSCCASSLETLTSLRNVIRPWIPFSIVRFAMRSPVTIVKLVVAPVNAGETERAKASAGGDNSSTPILRLP